MSNRLSIVDTPEVETEVIPPATAASGGDESVLASDTDQTVTGPVSPNLDERGIPIAWVLQVASVSTREKADDLTARLIEEGHKAYNRSIRRDGNVLFRVFVGPVFEREKLIVVKRELDAQLEVNGIISRYVP
jgi:DedD protein